MLRIGKYNDMKKESELYNWLMLNEATKVEGETLQSLYHPFDTQINEAMNNSVSRQCQKTKHLQDLVAYNIEWLRLLDNKHKQYQCA
jgi:DNA-dependent RNA polymerase auxiliary subunit epsilon